MSVSPLGTHICPPLGFSAASPVMACPCLYSTGGGEGVLRTSWVPERGPSAIWHLTCTHPPPVPWALLTCVKALCMCTPLPAFLRPTPPSKLRSNASSPVTTSSEPLLSKLGFHLYSIAHFSPFYISVYLSFSPTSL